MQKFRIVFNEQTRRFRIERRRLLWWDFLLDEKGNEYLSFDSFEEARRYLCGRLHADPGTAWRRWKVVDLCAARCAEPAA